MSKSSEIKGQEIIFLWDSPKDENGNHIPYEQYIIIIKYGSPFGTSNFAMQKTESISSISGQIFEIDGHTAASKGTGGYLTDIGANYKTYKITFHAQENGAYYFSVWSQRTLEGDRCGPVYYPGNTLGLDFSSGDPFPQQPYIVSNVRKDFVSLDESVSIYGLTAEGVKASYITSPSKSSGGGETKVILRGEHSPDFNYRAFLKTRSVNRTSVFSSKSRITIRKVSPNNTPSKTIYYLFPLGDIARYQTFEFPSEANSLEAINGKFVNGLFLDPREISNIPTYGYITTQYLTEEMIPLRDFDVVVEAYDPISHKTSAGNKLFDGWATINTSLTSEGDFKVTRDSGTTNARKELYGYDILEVRLEPPSSLIMLDEYNDSDSNTNVSQEVAYDLKIPYLLEFEITNDKHLMAKIKTSKKNGEEYVNAQDIFDTYFQDIRGMVLYYADEPFVLANEQIKIPKDDDINRDDTKQIFEVEKKPFSYDDKTSSMEVNRFFFLLKDLTIDKNLGTISAKLPKNMNAKKSNIVVGLFDTLLHQKHFDANGTARQLAAAGNIKTIYGEKNLNFSRVAKPVNEFSGDPRVGGTKNTFNPETIYNEDGTVKAQGDLTLNSASITVYSVSLIDEDKSKAFCYIIGGEKTAEVRDSSNIKEVVFSRTQPKGEHIVRNLNILIKLSNEFYNRPSIPLYIEKEDEEGGFVECGTGTYPCRNSQHHQTNPTPDTPYTQYEIQIKNWSDANNVAKIRDFEIRIEFSR